MAAAVTYSGSGAEKHTAWMPQPCRWNCMAAATMQFDFGMGGAGGSRVIAATGAPFRTVSPNRQP
jgi:hypothetical protein